MSNNVSCFHFQVSHQDLSPFDLTDWLTAIIQKHSPLSLPLLLKQEAFVDIVDQDQTIQNVQTDL